jgi:hypothetical protein
MPRRTDPLALTKRQRQRTGRKKESRRAKSDYVKQRRTSYSL